MLRSFRWSLWMLAGGCLVSLPVASWADTPKTSAKPAVPAAKVVVAKETAPVAGEAPAVTPVETADNANEATKKLIEQMQKEQAEATKLLKKHRDDAPFQQKNTIRLPAGNGMILGFCVLPSGTIATISGQSQTYGLSVNGALQAISGSQGKPVGKRVQWLDDSGKVLQTAELDFTPKAINSASDGTVIVVGEGQIARFDEKGKKLSQIESPHITQAVSNLEKFEAEVMEKHEEEIAQYEDQAKQFTETVKEVEAKPAAERSKSESAQLSQMKSITKSLEANIKAKKAMKKEVIVKQALTRLKELHRVAVSDKYVFVVSNETAGYGFCIWRMPHDFSEAKKVVSKLSGCCGQMDVQVMDGELAIAENSRHRVLLVDFDGKMNRSFGSTSRTDVTKGFGGCCNPMNTCCDAKGNLLTSESNGLVKLYKPNGEFQSIVGVAGVTEGCKNSSIGISPDGNSVYYFDVQKGEILVMKKGA